MTSYKFFEVQRINEVCVVRLSEADLFDMRNVRGFEQELMTLIDREQPAQLVVNFNAVEACSTEVISDMLKAKRRLLKHHGRIKLSGMTESLRGIYRLLNLDGTVFEIYDQPSDAIEAFGSN